jgi:hypothetical protein
MLCEVMFYGPTPVFLGEYYSAFTERRKLHIVYGDDLLARPACLTDLRLPRGAVKARVAATCGGDPYPSY